MTSIGGEFNIERNQSFDCINPVPAFVPVTRSSGNLANCDLVEYSASNNPLLQINDNASVGNRITITNEPGTIDTLSIELGIDHTYVSDLTLTLSKGATTIILKTDREHQTLKAASQTILMSISAICLPHYLRLTPAAPSAPLMKHSHKTHISPSSHCLDL